MDESWRMFSHGRSPPDATVVHAVAGVGHDERAGDAPPLRPGLGRGHRLPPGRTRRRPPGRTETRVIYGQPASEVDRARELLGLSDTEAKLLPNLPRGQALWKVGTRSFLVEHRLSATEAGLVDTDTRMLFQRERLTV
jgi:hypothetical protein